MPIYNPERKNNETINYKIRSYKDEKGIERAIFSTECSATDPGAIEVVRQKDGKNHKAGDVFYIKGGPGISADAITGVYMREGYGGGCAREVTVQMSSQNDKGGRVTEFLQMNLVAQDGKMNAKTMALLEAISKSDLGEPVMLITYLNHHKAGDPMSKKEDANLWEKDGATLALFLTQPHLKDADNEHGTVYMTKEEGAFTQPKNVSSTGKVTFDEESAIRHAQELVDGITDRVKNIKKHDVAPDQGPPPADDSDAPLEDADMEFGLAAGADEPAHTPAARPKA